MPPSLSPTLQARARDLAATLRHHGVQTVEADYDGYGDQGMFEHIAFLNEDAQPVEIPDTNDKSIEDFFYDLLEDQWSGWENNDGAFGTFAWDLQTNTLRHEHNSRYTDYDSYEDTITLPEHQS